MNPNLPDAEKCPICPNNRIVLRESPGLARIYCRASVDSRTFAANHQQCLAYGRLGLPEAETVDLAILNQAFSRRSFK